MRAVDEFAGCFAQKVGVGTGKDSVKRLFSGQTVPARQFTRLFQTDEGRPGGLVAFCVVPHLFAYRGLVADDIEYIIGYLKRNAQFTAVTARCMTLFR